MNYAADVVKLNMAFGSLMHQKVLEKAASYNTAKKRGYVDRADFEMALRDLGLSSIVLIAEIEKELKK